MTRLMTTRHHGPIHGRGICDGEVTAITSTHATEIFARCAPIASGTSKNGCIAQSRVIYENLAQMLEKTGADVSNVIIEKVYLRNIDNDLDDFRQIRLEVYRKRGISGHRLPAITYLRQPPCRAGQDIELQAYAVVPTKEGHVKVDSLPPMWDHGAADHGAAKVFEIGEARHLYLANIPGHNGDGEAPEDFRPQSDRMFEIANEAVRAQGATFPEVVRTWLYLDDIDRDYAALNDSRNAFFKQEGVRRLPASTGIGAGTAPSGNLGLLDAYALLNPEIAEIEIMKTPTLNEAPEYGAAFSRGMRMTLPETTYLFISGTASVDEQGATVHLADIRPQIDRMLVNIEELLRPHNATWGDLTQATTYLKSADYQDVFRELCVEHGLAEAPNTIVEADVCRPNLLCEMEAIAIIPTV